MIKDIASSVAKPKTNIEPAKFFFIDPETGEASQNFDTDDAATEAANAMLRKKDETGYEVYICQVVRTVRAERAIKTVDFGAKKR